MTTLRVTDVGNLEKDGVRIGKDERGQLVITAGGGVVALDAEDVALVGALMAS